MKRQKRNPLQRAYSKGYQAAIKGHNMEQCPYVSMMDTRGSWMGGWREGRKDYLAGYYTSY